MFSGVWNNLSAQDQVPNFDSDKMVKSDGQVHISHSCTHTTGYQLYSMLFGRVLWRLMPLLWKPLVLTMVVLLWSSKALSKAMAFGGLHWHGLWCYRVCDVNFMLLAFKSEPFKGFTILHLQWYSGQHCCWSILVMRFGHEPNAYFSLW